ncbi:glucose-1-phosphate adenylyltransferase [Methylohalobius crimeensis]|uniref:glucose-1-phosphate adenylyltransferase n=1 Tax=Methylohalobius crimeensis TaxID=244365 RepID=UPI0003B60092|nr:glucose-1-phosphate adenylyltransferase [Methylohalobius crimeensis]
MSENNYPQRFVSLLTRQTVALILAGGRGSRLKRLTDWRAKPAVHFGGKYRIIDFTLSNCLNSGIRRIGVLTQYKADSLIRHIQKGWGFLRGELGEFIDLLPAQQRIHDSWYKGTADAVYQNLDILRPHDPEYVLILAGDHVYKMDYGAMLAYHVENKADITVACVEVPVKDASAFGVIHVDDSSRIVDFVEKPDQPPAIPGRPDTALASMGIYVVNAKFLYEQLIKDADNSKSSHDFGKDILPEVINRYRAFAYPFLNMQTGVQSYWRDVGTIDAYWAANMELIGVNPELNLYDKNWPVWTYQEQVPPAKFVFEDTAHDRVGHAFDSMVCGGVIISGSTVRHSILSPNVRVNSWALVEHSVVLPDVNIGRYAKVRRAIIDRGCDVPQGMEIGYDLEKDKARFDVSPGGIVTVTPDMLGQKIHFVR